MTQSIKDRVQSENSRPRITIAGADPQFCAGVRQLIQLLNPQVEVVSAPMKTPGEDAVTFVDEPAGSPRLLNLTARQRQVLTEITKGHTNKQIARELQISPATVRAHVSALLRVLGVPTRTAAAALASRERDDIEV